MRQEMYKFIEKIKIKKFGHENMVNEKNKNKEILTLYESQNANMIKDVVVAR